jgi:hypothetical protein
MADVPGSTHRRDGADPQGNAPLADRKLPGRRIAAKGQITYVTEAMTRYRDIRKMPLPPVASVRFGDWMTMARKLFNSITVTLSRARVPNLRVLNSVHSC